MAGLVGRTLSKRYFLRELVGSGGMADVYLAWDNMRATKMAVKILRFDQPEITDGAYRRFEAEAELLQKLAHPSIVRIYEFLKDGEIFFFVMDWVDGGHNLRREIEQRHKPFSLKEISDILLPVCTALEFAHKHDVYHCDVKPANILLHKDGRVLLSDFGVARIASGFGGGGTPEYMAPEQFPEFCPGGRVDARTDIYALGVTLYQLLSGGRVPFNGDSSGTPGTTKRERIGWEHCNLSRPPIRKVNPDVPKPIAQVVEKAMDKEQDRRFSSTIELREAFERSGDLRNERGATAVIPKPSERPLPRLDATLLTLSQAILKPVGRSLPKLDATLVTLGQKIKASTEIFQKSHSVIKGPCLLAQSGEYAGQTIPLPRGEYLIGRAKTSQLQIKESTVSRKHAALIQTRKGVYIRDENSSLGTYVNGQRIIGLNRLQEGDIIKIGHQQVFEYRGK